MSTDNIQAFQAKVQSSPELQARVAEIKRQATVSAAEGLSRLAAEAGTPFTPAEFLAPLQELSEEELAGLAGGRMDVNSPIVSKEELDGSVWNLWNAFGKQYGYTTADGFKYIRSESLNVGDSIHSKRR